MIARFKTGSQLRREREHRRILLMFEEISKEHPDFRLYTRYAIIARTFNRSVNGIKRIVELASC